MRPRQEHLSEGSREVGSLPFGLIGAVAGSLGYQNLTLNRVSGVSETFFFFLGGGGWLLGL